WQRYDRLNRTFTERLFTHDNRTPVILQSSGDNFGTGGRTAVDHNHDRQAISKIARCGIIPLGVMFVASAGRYDLPLIDKRIRNCNGLIEKTAGIVTKIKDITDQ